MHLPQFEIQKKKSQLNAEILPLGIFLKSKNQMSIFNRGTFMAASPTSSDMSTPRGHLGS